jgi:hypothetical protein
MVYTFWVCQWVLKTLPHIFWMRFYFRTWHILMISFSWECSNCFGHFVFMCNLSTFIFHIDNTSFFFHVSFGRFRQESYANMCPHYKSKIMGVFKGPLAKHQAQLLISFCCICFFFMEDCALSTFLGNWALVALYLCFRFHIFDRSILEKYVSQIEG